MQAILSHTGKVTVRKTRWYQEYIVRQGSAIMGRFITKSAAEAFKKSLEAK